MLLHRPNLKMVDSLPSYGQATTRDPWSIIASHVRSADLCSAALVCRAWNDIFMSLLWGNPASHFGTENDAVYVALVRFKRTLVWARSSTRDLTHTLHFPPAQAEIYDGPKAEWLSEILTKLPNLQSLVVNHLPFFDHGALSSLVKGSLPNTIKGTPGILYHLRLLDASNCTNMTPQTLSEALKLFPALILLDLSGSPSARYSEVLSGLNSNQALQILKMQRLGLNDANLLVLAKAIGRNVRSLDLRNNNITDQGVQILIDNCIWRTNHASSRPRSLSRMPGIRLQEIFDGPQQDDFIRNQLTTGFSSYLGIENTLGSGVTHLYISENRMTVEGASELLSGRQLRVVDIGDLYAKVSQPSSSKPNLPLSISSLSSAEKLISIIEGNADRLAYLRINHTVITRLTSYNDQHAVEPVSTTTVSAPNHTAELDTVERAMYEMPNDSLVELPGDVPPLYELEGSSAPVVVHLPNEPPMRTNGIDDNSSVPAIDMISAISPDLDACGGLFSPVSPLALHKESPQQGYGSTVDGHLTVPLMSSPSGLEIEQAGLEVDDGQAWSRQSRIPRVRTYSAVLGDHDAQLRYQQSQSHALIPGSLPSLRTLVLTKVPAKASTPDIAKRIMDFVTACAGEEQWANLQASLGYQIPPGRDRRSAEEHLARSLFPLRKLVLEMAPEEKNAEQSGDWFRPLSATQTTLSSTLDADCETYLNAAKDDFSFFDTEEECGQPGDEGTYIPIDAFKEKMIVEDPSEILLKSSDNNGTRSTGLAPRPGYDVLAEIGQFRRAKRAEYEAKVARGEDATTDGHWTGIIEIVRPT